MRAKIAAFLLVLATPGALLAREGTPTYYQNNYQAPGYRQVASTTGQPVYVGSQPSRNVVGQRSYQYQVPRAMDPSKSAAMTPNGVAIPSENNPYSIKLSAYYGRKFADFQFETGVQSILEWDNMVISEITLRAEKEFNIRDYNILAFGEYSRGTMLSSGLSMDYDLKPYDDSQPEYGIFTISMGDQSGKMQNMKLGISAKNVWDISGWKISPVIGYQIFKHDMQMSNHIYPNPAVYIPLMNQFGEYIYGDEYGNYYSVAPGIDPGDGYYQVCMSPEDLALAASDPNTHAPIIDPNTGELLTTAYDPLYDMYLPWGVGPGECVVIGGDGIIKVDGVTHIYNTTWSGIYLGVEIEKQMTYVDKLRFYAQISKPHYRSEGTWPNRTDWQQNPSFLDEGDNGAMHYQAEMEYIYKFSDRLELSLKASLEYFHIGAVGGELYVAGYNYYRMTEDGTAYVLQDTDGDGIGDTPILDYQPPYTENISDSLKNATWQAYGLHLGVKYAF